MSITVVTVRDEYGAPSTREVYASADRYTDGGGTLQILSASQPLAMYPSGNWMSAYVDDCVQVVPHDRIAVTYRAPGDTSALVTSGDSGSDTAVATDLGSRSDGDTNSEIALTDLAETESTDLAETESTDLAETDTEPADTDADTEPELATDLEPATDSEEPVSGQRAVSPAPDTFPPGIRRVAFRPISVKAPRVKQDDGPDRSHLRPVAIRPRILNSVRDEQDVPTEPRSDRFRSVAFAPRTYRAARRQPAPEDVQRERDELYGPDSSAQ